MPEESRHAIYMSVLSYCLISARNEIQNHQIANPDDVRLTGLTRALIGILYNPETFTIEMAYWTNNATIKHALVHPDEYLAS